MILFKKLIVGFALITLVVSVSCYDGDGQPGCKTQEEIDIQVFRNDWDPTHYWKCTNLNETATLERCPESTAFLDKVKDCVGWDEWQWTPPEPPLSEPDN